jgi:hypothetical protein
LRAALVSTYEAPPEVGEHPETMPLDRVGDAWARQARGHDVKLVLVQ